MLWNLGTLKDVLFTVNLTGGLSVGHERTRCHMGGHDVTPVTKEDLTVIVSHVLAFFYVKSGFFSSS